MNAAVKQLKEEIASFVWLICAHYDKEEHFLPTVYEKYGIGKWNEILIRSHPNKIEVEFQQR